MQLQKIDLNADSMNAGERLGEEKLSELTEEIGRATESIAEIEAETGTLTESKNESSETIRVSTEKIKADQQKLNSIKNDKQYKALTKEIKSAENASRLAEMEMASVTEKLTEREEELAKVRALLDEKSAEKEKLSGESETTKKENAEAIEKLNAEKETIAKDVSPSLIKKYDMIRQRRSGLGVVNVLNEACQGCFIQIPPQLYLQLMKGTEEIITCPHCHRILYCKTEES